MTTERNLKVNNQSAVAAMLVTEAIHTWSKTACEHTHNHVHGHLHSPTWLISEIKVNSLYSHTDFLAWYLASHMHVCMCGVEVRGLLVRNSFLHHINHRDGNTSHQAWQQAP